MIGLHTSKHRTQKAFTLIEMLVVMVIMSLLITVVMQGFVYSLGIYQRVTHTQKNAYSEVLFYRWICETLSSQAAARPKDIGLEGIPSSLSTYTYQPLIGSNGVKTRISWGLVQEGESLSLHYYESDQDLTVYTWSESQGHFEYLGKDNAWQSKWPLEKSDTPALPLATKLRITTRADERNYVMVLGTRERPEVTMDEALYGR